MIGALAQIHVDPSFWIWLIALIILVLIGGGIIFAVRRRLFMEDTSPDFQSGGMLEQIRALRDQGKITDEEYEETRRSLIEKVSASKSSPTNES